MEIFVLRHGNAEDVAPRDSLRALSAKGEREVRYVMERSLSELSGVEHIFVSPYLRAQQTADIAEEFLLRVSKNLSRSATELLTPMSDPFELMDMLQKEVKEKNISSVLLVSHLPFVAEFVEALCGLDRGYCHMGTASLASVETDVVAAGCANLRFLKQKKD